jgi:serine/threonine-protein kinase
VKVLPPEPGRRECRRFNREIVPAAGLQHPHRPRAQRGADGWRAVLHHAAVDGESLRARLTRTGGRRSPKSSACCATWRRRSRTRTSVESSDIKPTTCSCLAVRRRSPTSARQGASASRTAAPGATLTQIGTSIGTPTYMSPEQAAGDQHRSSRRHHSFGCLAYELLAGRPPFVAVAAEAARGAHGRDPLPSVSSAPIRRSWPSWCAFWQRTLTSVRTGGDLFEFSKR